MEQGVGNDEVSFLKLKYSQLYKAEPKWESRMSSNGREKLSDFGTDIVPNDEQREAAGPKDKLFKQGVPSRILLRECIKGILLPCRQIITGSFRRSGPIFRGGRRK